MNLRWRDTGKIGSGEDEALQRDGVWGVDDQGGLLDGALGDLLSA